MCHFHPRRVLSILTWLCVCGDENRWMFEYRHDILHLSFWCIMGPSSDKNKRTNSQVIRWLRESDIYCWLNKLIMCMLACNHHCIYCKETCTVLSERKTLFHTVIRNQATKIHLMQDTRPVSVSCDLPSDDTYKTTQYTGMVILS